MEVVQLSAWCLVRPSAVLLCVSTRTASTETARHIVSLPTVRFNTFGTSLTWSEDVLLCFYNTILPHEEIILQFTILHYFCILREAPVARYMQITSTANYSLQLISQFTYEGQANYVLCILYKFLALSISYAGLYNVLSSSAIYFTFIRCVYILYVF